ncbi:MAG TPA: trimethylamine methyltransferase family protein [Candidatus Binatia bacterium]|nr:trimethylamine methyltransferase family protein [Candidatus Binatia bacterium]
MRFQSQLLADHEKEIVHQETLRILFEAGVLFHSGKVLRLLESKGARVEWEKKTAHIPKELVEQSLHTAPKAFTLGARNPNYDYPLPSPVSRYALDGTGAFAQDFHTGERRYGTDHDSALGLRVFQAMDMGIMAWAPVSAEDKPGYTRPLHEFFTVMKNTSKHGQHEVHHVEQVPYLAEGLIAVMGSEDEVCKRHAYSLIYCPVAPLMHDGPMMDAYIELGSLDMPVMVLPMPVTGTTGPVTLFGNICVANAEALSTIIVYQLAHPGRPVIYSSATGTMDLRSGAYMGGTPEMGLMSAALAEMGRFYGLPATSAGCTSDAREAGPDAVLEKVITSIAPVLGGSDIIVGFGEVESDQLLILEQIVVDNEIAHFCERVFQGVDVRPEKILTEDILSLGPGGNFLTRRSTRNLARSGELYVSGLLDRHTQEQWMALAKPNMYSNARKKVEEILAAPVQDPLPENVIQELEDILAHADRQLASSARS